MKVVNKTKGPLFVNTHGNKRLTFQAGEEKVLTPAEAKLYGVSLENLRKAGMVVFGSADDVKKPVEAPAVAPAQASAEVVEEANKQAEEVVASSEEVTQAEAMFEKSALEAMEESELKELAKTHQISIRGKKTEHLIESLLEIRK